LGQETACPRVAARDYPQNLGELSKDLPDSYGFGIEDELELRKGAPIIGLPKINVSLQLTLNPRVIDSKGACIYGNHHHPEVPRIRQTNSPAFNSRTKSWEATCAEQRTFNQ
jgi:hypothetical protein